MSLVLRDHEMHPHLVGDRACFLCGEGPLSDAVVWSGATGLIALHPDCAVDLVLRLGRDAWEAQTKKLCGRGRR